MLAHAAACTQPIIASPRARGGLFADNAATSGTCCTTDSRQYIQSRLCISDIAYLSIAQSTVQYYNRGGKELHTTSCMILRQSSCSKRSPRGTITPFRLLLCSLSAWKADSCARTKKDRPYAARFRESCPLKTRAVALTRTAMCLCNL